jgi:hypothetical protein
MPSQRHCEEPLRRSNPSRHENKEWIASSRRTPRKKLGLGKAAATIKIVVARLDRAIQYAAASHLSQTSLEYWVARSSRAMTAVFVSSIRVGPKAGTELAMTL